MFVILDWSTVEVRFLYLLSGWLLISNLFMVCYVWNCSSCNAKPISDKSEIQVKCDLIRITSPHCAGTLILSVSSLISLTAALYLLASSLSSSWLLSDISFRWVHSSSVLLSERCKTGTKNFFYFAAPGVDTLMMFTAYLLLSYLHLGQLPDHLDLLLQDSPQRLLRCRLIVVFVLLKRQELLTDPFFRLGLLVEERIWSINC